MKASEKNLFTDGASGTARNMTIRQKKSGKQIISRRRGPSTVPLTAPQQTAKEKFLQAITYGKSVLADPAKTALYQAIVQPDQSAYGLAVRDAVKPPKVTSIDHSEYTGTVGDKLTVRATDDFKVASLRVFIYKADGTLLEKGDGVAQSNNLDWVYTVTQANATLTGTKITATATDLPNNSSSLEITL